MIWRILPFRSDSAFENMAIDEAVFRETIKKDQPPTLRFFSWCRPSISIGYFQEIQKEIDYECCRRNRVDIVRRITGGKAVYHCDEITYSLSAAASERLFPNDINRTYEIISLCLARGLSYLGINAYLAGQVDKKKKVNVWSSCCFSAPSGNELLVSGRKICGSAQTRTHGGFLQHGSLLMTFDPAITAALVQCRKNAPSSEELGSGITAINELLRTPVQRYALIAALQKGFVDELGIQFSEETLTMSEKALAAQLVKKYKSEKWTWERQKEGFQ